MTHQIDDFTAPSDEHKVMWYLAYSKPKQEAVAKFNLDQQAFEVFLPLFKKFKTTSEGPLAFFEPMFPRYIFFRPKTSGQTISVVRSTKGVNNIVRFGFEPATIEGELVSRIRQLEQARNHATIEETSNLKVGQSVVLKHTALGSIQGLVQNVSSKRVAVLLEILGRPTVVKLEHHQVEAFS